MTEGIMPAPVKEEASVAAAPVEGNVQTAVKPESQAPQPEVKKGVSFLHRIKSMFARHISGGDQITHPAEAQAAPSQAPSETTPTTPAPEPQAQAPVIPEQRTA